MYDMTLQRIKIITSLIISLLIVFFLKEQVFIGSSPLIRPDAPTNIVSLPKKIANSTTVLLAKVIPARSSTQQPDAKISPAPKTGPFNPPDSQNPGPTEEIVPTKVLPTTPPTATPALITIPPPTIPPNPNGGQLPPTQPPPPVTKVEFAQCLTSKGMKFYMNSSCPYCKKQKDMFGPDAYRYVTEINCNTQTQLCRSKPGVGIGPAWETGTGKIYPGYMDLQSLGYASSCPKPTS